MPPLLELTITPPFEPKKGFLGLPREVRELIYVFTLVQPIKWSRRHRATCDRSPRTCTVFERPLFTHAGRPACGCGRRTGLGLLLANRQVHREAAPVFWARNPHCFSLAPEFSRDVGETLRPEYRPLLRRVSVMSIVWAFNQPYGNTIVCNREQTAQFWATVMQCTGLETLEVHPFYGWWHLEQTGLLGRLADGALPRLRSFSWEKLIYFNVGKDAAGKWLDFPKLQTLYCLAAKEVDVKGFADGRAVRESIRDFETNFLVHVRFAVETELLGHATQAHYPTQNPSYRSFSYKLRSGLDDRCPGQSLKLRDCTTTTVQLLGLPYSAETRKRNARERYLHDVLLRKEGKPTAREEKLAEFVKARRKSKKEKKEKQEDWERARDKVQKAQRQTDDRQWMERQEKAEETKRKLALEQSLRAAAELKRLERKKVPRPR